MPSLATELQIGEQLCLLARELPVTARAAETLSLQATKLMEAAGMADGKTALLGRYLGDEAKLAQFAGKPVGLAGGANAEAVFYGPGRNLYSLENGGLRIVRPTPSGQALRVEEFAANASNPSSVSYLRGGGLVDRVGVLQGKAGDFSFLTDGANMRLSGTEFAQTTENGLHLPVQVRTLPTSREFLVGGAQADAQLASRVSNFPPGNDIIDAVRGTQPLKGQPLHFSHPFTSQHYGLDVTTPLARDGKLVGFDARTGEALVNFDNGVRFAPGTEVVKPQDLELGRYHLGLDGTKQTIMRDTLGRIYGVETAYSPYFGYRLNPAQNIYAFSPSELMLPSNQSLATALSVPETAGLRALGGYDTLFGGALHIGL
ncbi:MAG TPA: hypothetical protein V6C69_02955 [Trichormus sp.]|jgi:hypothetical protein